MEPIIVFITLLAFLVGSALAAIVGLGGGIIYTPLMLTLGYDLIGTVLPVSLFLIFATSFTAAISYYRQGLVDVRLSALVGLAAGVGAPIGAKIALILPELYFVLILSSVITFTAIKLLLNIRKNGAAVSPESSAPYKPPPAWFGLLLGVAASTIAALLGVGGGLIIVPALIFAGLSPKKAVGTASGAMILISSFGFAAHLPSAKFNFALLPIPAAVVLGGAFIGAKVISPRVKPVYIQIALAIIMLLVMSRLLLNVLL